MNKTIRKQLTLFIGEPESEIIEKVRGKFNPFQSELIRCHVTLCREHEIDRLDLIKENLNSLTYKKLTIQFGNAVRFNEGKGVLLPANEESSEFQQLRKHILKGIVNDPEKPLPHITLIHPRNAICTDVVFDEITELTFPETITFDRISLIEQVNGKKWNILEEFRFP